MRCFFRMSDLATGNLIEMRDITDEIINYIRESQIKNGHILIQPMHTTVGIYLNEGSSNLNLVKEIDLRFFFEHGCLPNNKDNKRDCSTNELFNHHAYLKSMFFSNPNLSLIIFGGKLQIGEGQRILFAEFDGPCPRDHKDRRRYVISIIGA